MIVDDEEGFRALTRRVSRDAGLTLDAYKDKCLRRRLLVRMRACSVHTYAEYLAVLDRRPEEWDKLKDALTINVTRFYRNPETWDRLRDDLLPGLLAARQGRLAAWSAGCSSGEEPYTVAMLCAEAIEAAGRSAWSERVRILATDIDRESLRRSEAAVYPDAAFLEAPGWMTEKYCERAGEGWQVRERVRRMVTVQRLDLTREAVPVSTYDLILCRNVVIYFDRPTQERLFAQFAEALQPGGILVLGKVETLLGVARDRLTLVDARERIFRRAA
ncbi:MAG TPA: protein-glutamate O-methyltransferase CheR [Gemmatimonadales bacterium]|nr:protein-glutamate O-methyltransferase CheR [Gemmatimonadales bacterium]